LKADKYIEKIKNKKQFKYILKYTKAFFSFFENLEKKQIEKNHGTSANFHIFNKSSKVLIYRLFIYSLLIFLISYFRTDIVYLTESFFNLFRIKKIFRLDEFSTLMLIKAVNAAGLLSILLIIIAAFSYSMKWVNTKVILLEKELILEEGSFFKLKSHRILKKEIKSVCVEKNIIEILFKTARISLFVSGDENKISLSGMSNASKLYLMLTKKS
jgi:hypothetical protein